LVRNGQALLPMMELIEQSRMAIDELIDVMGRASVEAILGLSARQVAGEPQQGKARAGEIGWHGTQPWRVNLKERKLRYERMIPEMAETVGIALGGEPGSDRGF
jgi:hypothetical protein